MKKFILKTFIFFLPILLIVILVAYIDFFKVFSFHDYYDNQIVETNREMITTKTFDHYRHQEKFNSFIFGSSRSQAFRCEDWAEHLDDKAKPFHFDASGEGVWGISKKIEYIDELGDSLTNALVILDRVALTVSYPRKGHLYASMPQVSKSSSLAYYAEFLKASLNIKFLTAYLDYSIFNTHRSYMRNLINPNINNANINKINCDIWLSNESKIKSDSVAYYTKLIANGVFYKRPHATRFKSTVTLAEVKQLKTIKRIFEKHKTNYKIILAPIYDQVPLEEAQLQLLLQIFGSQNVYNFSGKNAFTESVGNYYEASHFRHHVAKEIIELVYKEK
jgi:hypothetical protein